MYVNTAFVLGRFCHKRLIGVGQTAFGLENALSVNNIRSSTAPISRIIKYCVICLISLRSVFTAIKCFSEPIWAFLYTGRSDRFPYTFIQLFRERLSEKVHANLPELLERPWTYVCEC